MNVALNAIQQEQRALIEMNLELVRPDINEQAHQEHEQLFAQMADVAHELHMSLELPPNHKRSMIEARRIQLEVVDFYRSIHAVEGLLVYLDNTEANNEPEDQTMGDAFEMLIYSHIWGHEDRYSLTRNEQG